MEYICETYIDPNHEKWTERTVFDIYRKWNIFNHQYISLSNFVVWKLNLWPLPKKEERKKLLKANEEININPRFWQWCLCKCRRWITNFLCRKGRKKFNFCARRLYSAFFLVQRRSGLNHKSLRYPIKFVHRKTWYAAGVLVTVL